MLSRRKVLSTGVAAASALMLAAGTAATAVIAAPPARSPKRPFIPQPARFPADYVPCC
jgi:hypothetical protein